MCNFLLLGGAKMRNDDFSIEEALYAQAIGQQMLNYGKQYPIQSLVSLINSEAISVIKEIKTVLDNDRLDDPSCFYRIDEIVRIFQMHHLSTERHWELE